MFRRGFSLLELCLVLGISAAVVGVVVKNTKSSSNITSVSGNDCYVSTKQKLSVIRDSINNFAHSQDRLPIPAPRNVGTENKLYGIEAGSTALIDQHENVSFGAVPFQTLGLRGEYAGDCWGNKFTYMVTTALTVKNGTGGYLDDTQAGNIVVKTSATAAPDTSNLMAYAVISHGEDGLGAVKLNQTMQGHGWCDLSHNGSVNANLSVTTVPLKQVNCLAQLAVVANTTLNNGKDAGTGFFDDLVVTSGKPLATTVVGGGGASCALPWGGTLTDGATVTAYQNSSLPCTSEVRTCTNGTLSGSYANGTCAGAGCNVTLNGVSTAMTHGQMLKRYHLALQPDVVPVGDCTNGFTCPAECTDYQAATCNNGTIIGTSTITFTQTSCTASCQPVSTSCGDPDA